MNEARAERPTRVEGGQTHPNLRPRDAATLIVLDRTGAVPKVLLGRRHHGHAFMPGKYVFPGGRVEPSDYTVPVASPLHPEIERRLMAQVHRPSAARARALAVAAIRELGEETGLFIGHRGEPAAVGHGPWRGYPDAGVIPDLGRLFFLARAITPPRRARRFDTRFFVADADAIAHRIEGLVTPESELVDLVWMPLNETAGLDMVTITKVVLGELQERVAAGLSPGQPAPFYRMLNRRFVRELL
jgi:8-oxo-dGTP pyrophosphatase MutT (NUDIX family)